MKKTIKLEIGDPDIDNAADDQWIRVVVTERGEDSKRNVFCSPYIKTMKTLNNPYLSLFLSIIFDFDSGTADDEIMACMEGNRG